MRTKVELSFKDAKMTIKILGPIRQLGLGWVKLGLSAKKCNLSLVWFNSLELNPRGCSVALGLTS
jgi:hypothetical protein